MQSNVHGNRGYRGFWGYWKRVISDNDNAIVRYHHSVHRHDDLIDDVLTNVDVAAITRRLQTDGIAS